MNDDPVAQLFMSTMQQYSQQLDPETMNYLLRTYQMGQQDVAFSNLVSCLVDVGYNEDQLLQGPLSQLAQALQVQTSWSADPDPAAIRRTGEHPDPFAEAAARLSPPEFRQTQVPNTPSAPDQVAGAQSGAEPPAGQPPAGNIPSTPPPAPQTDNDGTLHIR